MADYLTHLVIIQRDWLAGISLVVIHLGGISLIYKIYFYPLTYFLTYDMFYVWSTGIYWSFIFYYLWPTMWTIFYLWPTSWPWIFFRPLTYFFTCDLLFDLIPICYPRPTFWPVTYFLTWDTLFDVRPILTWDQFSDLRPTFWPETHFFTWDPHSDLTHFLT